MKSPDFVRQTFFLLKPKEKRFTIKIITIFAIEECIAYINNIYGVVWI